MKCVISLENVRCFIRLSLTGAFSFIVLFCGSQYMPLAIRRCHISLSLRMWQLSSRNSAVTPLPDFLKFQILLYVLRLFSRTPSIHQSFRWISAANHTRHGNVFRKFNPLKPELNSICYLLALLGAHHFLHVSRIRVKLLTFRLLMSYIYGAPILDVSRSHTTTQHSR